MTTYVLAREKDIETIQRHYYERVDSLRDTAQILWVTEDFTRESEQLMSRILFSELQEALTTASFPNFNDNEWDLYSFATLVKTSTDVHCPDAFPSTLSARLCIHHEDEAELPIPSRTRVHILSRTGNVLPNGSVFRSTKFGVVPKSVRH
ncbi:hypothetical protein P4N68_02150 [Corynebacterium felinum]|uniref:Uncharacterized protein n=1 Tax=Corynebacterium felinum TaxID=131318 RepID=A0ABU2BBK4_9CORY|nr:hypothetical protein [Corynebacterium felinum]MDF5819884.1 hypothetical protein [Corynebacterium felinum]MDR7355973.1 hypothetical protein [Corynebacterium felinum]